ncbi:Sulfotransferase family cytosolic 2B member 1, partial [Spheniscus demersus]
RLCRFLGQDLDDDAVSSVVQNASFMAMWENPMCSSILLPADIMDQTKGQFLRKG